MTDPDRTVFAVLKGGGEIVRYDRAGKWWLEYLDGSMRPGRQIKVKEAAYMAAERAETVFPDRLGGQTFYHYLKTIQNRERLKQRLAEERP